MKTPRMPMTPWNKGKLVGQKSTLETERNLVDPDQAPAFSAESRVSFV